jgi:hypothetical protein
MRLALCHERFPVRYAIRVHSPCVYYRETLARSLTSHRLEPLLVYQVRAAVIHPGGSKIAVLASRVDQGVVDADL